MGGPARLLFQPPARHLHDPQIIVKSVVKMPDERKNRHCAISITAWSAKSTNAQEPVFIHLSMRKRAIDFCDHPSRKCGCPTYGRGLGSLTLTSDATDYVDTTAIGWVRSVLIKRVFL